MNIYKKLGCVLNYDRYRNQRQALKRGSSNVEDVLSRSKFCFYRKLGSSWYKSLR